MIGIAANHIQVSVDDITKANNLPRNFGGYKVIVTEEGRPVPL